MRSEDKWIWGLFAFSIVILTCTDFIFAKTPAYNDFIYQLGRTANNLSLAYISSIIFYWIVVSIPDARKKRSIYKYVYERTGNVLGDCEALLAAFIKASAYNPVNKNLTQSDFLAILSKIKPYDTAPLIVAIDPNTGQYVYANWVGYMEYQKSRSFDFMNKIIENMIFLESEPEFIHLLREVKDHSYFVHIQGFLSYKMNNSDFSFFAPTMFRYYESLKQLKEYADKNFAKYNKEVDLSGMRYF